MSNALTHYLVAFGGVWGKAETLGQAKVRYRRIAGKALPATGAHVYRVSAEATVDELGRLYAKEFKVISEPADTVRLNQVGDRG